MIFKHWYIFVQSVMSSISSLQVLRYFANGPWKSPSRMTASVFTCDSNIFQSLSIFSIMRSDAQWKRCKVLKDIVVLHLFKTSNEGSICILFHLRNCGYNTINFYQMFLSTSVKKLPKMKRLYSQIIIREITSFSISNASNYLSLTEQVWV